MSLWINPASSAPNSFHQKYATSLASQVVTTAPYTPNSSNHYLEVNGVMYHDVAEVTFTITATSVTWAWVNTSFALDAADELFLHAYVSN